MSLMKKLIDKFKSPYDHDDYQVTGDYENSSDADKKVLKQLLDGGADLAKPRHVLHYLYFVADADAEGATSDLRTRGYAAEVRVSPDAQSEFPYLVVAERTGVVNEVIVEDERVLMAEIAAQHMGEHDGWEASMD